MVAIASLVTKRPDKGLGAICGPHRLVIEGCSIPIRLIEHLGDLDRVGGWATSARWVCGVALVVVAVQVLAIPASWEPDTDHDANLAGARRKAGSRTGSRRASLQTCVGEHGILADLRRSSEGWVSNSHAEAGLKSSNLAVGEIIDGLATGGSTKSERVTHGRNTAKASIPGLEVDYGGPVIGEVLGRCAGGT
jgi:hypothetical protein